MTDQGEKLEACPHCESDNVSLSYSTNLENVISHRFVECEDCAACGPTHTTPEGAARLWNRRTPSPAGGLSGEDAAWLATQLGEARPDEGDCHTEQQIDLAAETNARIDRILAALAQPQPDVTGLVEAAEKARAAIPPAMKLLIYAGRDELLAADALHKADDALRQALASYRAKTGEGEAG
jgi:hypothetical protein